MKRFRWLVLFSLLAFVAGAETVSAQVPRLDATKLSTSVPAAQSDEDWHAAFDPLVTHLINLDDQIRSMEVRLNEIARIPDRATQLLEVRNFEKSVLDKEAEALRIGLDVIAQADSFLPTAQQTMEGREKTVLVIEIKILLIIVRVVQIKSTIIIIKESRIPPTIPPVGVTTGASGQKNPPPAAVRRR